MTHVLDAYALMAYFEKEPGYEQAAQLTFLRALLFVFVVFKLSVIQQSAHRWLRFWGNFN